MPTRENLMTLGVPANLANVLSGTVTTGLTATGSTQDGALLVQPGLNAFSTVASSTGARLPPASTSGPVFIVNGGANTLAVYPATGEYINAGSVNAGFNVTNAKNGLFIPFGNRWFGGLFA